MAVQLAPGSLRGASGRCHAKLLREPDRSQAIVPFRMLQCISAYRAALHSRLKRRSGFQVPESSIYGGYF
jgi:hypothetical protein